MRPVTDQMLIFLLVGLWGVLAGVIYDLYRLLRWVWRPKRLGTNLGDVIFWIILTSLSYAFLMVSIWGEIRFYVFLAMGIGLFCYMKFASRKIRKFIAGKKEIR